MYWYNLYMSQSASKDKLVENEVVFRTRNEQVEKGFQAIKRIAAEDGQLHMVKKIDQPLHFFCECSDENCQKRVVIEPSIYNDIHTQRDQFIVLPEHDVQALEQIVAKKKGYWIVKKYGHPPETSTKLHHTDIDNSVK